MCRPVQRAEKGAGGDRRIGRAQGAAADAVGDHRAHAALVAIPLGDDEAAEGRRQGVDLEMRRGALHLVEQAEDVRRGELAQAIGERPARAADRGQRRQQPIERPVLAEEEDFVLAAEVVIQVAGRQVRGHRDVAHAGGSKPVRPEDARRRAHDLEPAGVGAE